MVIDDKLCIVYLLTWEYHWNTMRLNRQHYPIMKENRNELKLLSQELNNPYRQLNLVFLLIGIIPILACIYLLYNRLFLSSQSLSQTALILFFSNVIIILGYIVGYGIVKNILNKILVYATRAKRAD